jgi:hypothetical protein
MWRQWIGLPHIFRADPRDGIGADCLIMTWNVLDAAGVPHPAFNSSWLDLAETGAHQDLAQLYEQSTIPLDAPEEYSITLFAGARMIGVGVVVDNGLLYIHHRRGVQWISLDRCRPLEFRKFK